MAAFTQPEISVQTDKGVTGGCNNILTPSFVQTLHKIASQTLQMLREAYCPDAMKKFECQKV